EFRPKRFDGFNRSDLGLAGHTKKTSNNQHPTTNIQWGSTRCTGCWLLDIECSMFPFSLALVEIFLDALGFAQQKRRVFLGQLGEFFQRLHRLLELLGKVFM